MPQRSALSPFYREKLVTLFCADACDVAAHVLATEQRPFVLVTDPPYGMNYRSGWSGSSIAGDESTAARDDVLSVLKPDAAIVFGRWNIERPPGVRQLLIWDKGDWPGMGDLAFPWGPSTEEIYILGDGFAGKRTGQIVRDPKRPSGERHPHEKPIGLMEQLLAKCPDGVVVDPFCGSGSTVIAARNLGRRVIACDLEQDYVEVARDRLRQQSFSF